MMVGPQGGRYIGNKGGFVLLQCPEYSAIVPITWIAIELQQTSFPQIIRTFSTETFVGGKPSKTQCIEENTNQAIGIWASDFHSKFSFELLLFLEVGRGQEKEKINFSEYILTLKLTIMQPANLDMLASPYGWDLLCVSCGRVLT